MDFNTYGNSAPFRRHVWLLPFKRTHRDLFMSFLTLDRLVILTAEHVYSGRPDDRFSDRGLLRGEFWQQTCYLLSIQCLTGVTEIWFILLTIFGGKSCGQNNWSFGYYAVLRPFLAKVHAIPLLCVSLVTIIFARRYAPRFQGKSFNPRIVYKMLPYWKLVPTGSSFCHGSNCLGVWSF